MRIDPRSARAFTVSSSIADGCHEQITEDELRTVHAVTHAHEEES